MHWPYHDVEKVIGGFKIPVDRCKLQPRLLEIYVYLTICDPNPDFRLHYDAPMKGLTRADIPNKDGYVRSQIGLRVGIHRNILSAVSPYFQQAFANGKDNVDWSGYSYEAVEAYLDLLYYPVKRLYLFYLKDYQDVYNLSLAVKASHMQVRLAFIHRLLGETDIPQLIDAFKFLHQQDDIGLLQLLTVHQCGVFEARNKPDPVEAGVDEALKCLYDEDCGELEKEETDYDSFSNFLDYARQFFNFEFNMYTCETRC